MTSHSRITNASHIHIIGIGGAGMSPLARILLQQGKVVSGSDQQPSPVTESLKALGAIIFDGHHAQNIASADLVVASAAVKADNPELLAAAKLGIPTIRGAVLLGEMMRGKTAICVAGTHGKTTTTAMIAKVLGDAGLDPSYVIGGEPRDLPASGHSGQGDYFVAEADEYDRRFLSLHPAIAVITSIEPDHPDCYPTPESLLEAFRTFVSLLPAKGWLVGCGDDARVWDLGRPLGSRFVSYGLSGRNEWTASSIATDQDGRSSFQARREGGAPAAFGLAVPGEHNIRNALAAMAVAALANVDERSVQGSLAAFTGVGRRFEVVGDAYGATLVDDYAHHPTEIRATLAAARVRYPGRRIVAVHQPHTYSRLKALLPDFAAAFGDADDVLILDIYPSRETDTLGMHSRDLAAAIRHTGQLAVTYTGAIETATEHLVQTLRIGDVLITLGAGDVNRILRLLMAGDQASRQWAGQALESPEANCRSIAREAAGATSVDIMTPIRNVEPLLRRDEPMWRHTTFGIGGPADFYAAAESEDDMAALTAWARERGIPARVIGGGANLLVSDAGARELIIENRIAGCTVNSSQARVLAGAGIPLADLAVMAAAKGLAGLEWAVGLPGSLGGAIVGNAGAFGGYMDQVVRSVAILPASGQAAWWDAQSCGFTYRGSRFKSGQASSAIILRAELQLRRGDAAGLEQTLRGYGAKREASQPWQPSAGSVFKRTSDHPAGWLIEQAGLKGRGVGGAQISPMHANFILNNGHATAADVLALIELARETVKTRFGVDLELEIEMVGMQL